MQEDRKKSPVRLLDRTYGSERIAALSDGVFAIILTLLVLELKIPDLEEATERALMADLESQLPNVIAWLISFVLVARFWLVQHELLQHLTASKLGTIVMNLALLCVVSLVPFGSGLIGTYEFDFAAVAVFSTVMGCSGLTIGLFARHVARNQHLHRPQSETDPVLHWRYHTVGLPLFAVLAIGYAWIHHPGIALALWILEPGVALAYAMRRARAERTVR